MRRLKTTLTALFVTGMLVIGVDYASYAATGSSLLLGKANSTPNLTTVTRTKAGPALSVKTKTKKSAPFVVNGKGRVANLNADLLDGIDASALGSRGLRLVLPGTEPDPQVYLTVPIPQGTYWMSYAAVINTPAATAGCEIRTSEDALVSWAHAMAPTDGDGDVLVSASDIVEVSGSSGVILSCKAVDGSNVNLFDSWPSSFNAIRLSSLTKTVLPAPTP